MSLLRPRRLFATVFGRRQLTSSSQPSRENIGIVRAYGKPVATIFLWSALTYMSLQGLWSKLYYDEVRLETEAKIDTLNAELERLGRPESS